MESLSAEEAELGVQSEGSDLQPPGSVGFPHAGRRAGGADGGGGGDEGEGAEAEGERRERREQRRGEFGRRRRDQSGVDGGGGGGGCGGGGPPERTLICVRGGAPAASARGVGLRHGRGRRRSGGAGRGGGGRQGRLRAAAAAAGGGQSQRLVLVLLVLQQQRVAEVGRGGGEGRAPGQMAQAGVGLPLAGVVVEVGHQAQAEGVGAVQPLHQAQVARRLSQTLPEAQTSVVHGQSVGVEKTCGDSPEMQDEPLGSVSAPPGQVEVGPTFTSGSVQHLQVVHGHLQDLGFLQLGRALQGEADKLSTCPIRT